MADYSGSETAVDLGAVANSGPDEWFDVRPPTVPASAVPVFDESLDAVIGYRHEAVTGVFKLYDLHGTQVAIEEVGLESPLIDPLDLAFIVGGLVRSAARGIGRGVLGMARGGARGLIMLTGGRLAARSLAVSVAGAMRASYRLVFVRNLKFTATTAARMATAGRHVPLQILQLAIRHGKRIADPQGVKGAFQYTTQMIRNGRQYTLDVVVRESDWTVLHFHYH
ncbi:hypothetical protein BurJ1DRAFT_1257 [Burkholderiales bacterium JOSHI_001]|nr:hypothetical protein BurJ1DRAFT_1257 [Burkholderiales bacterium JOSHI_001]